VITREIRLGGVSRARVSGIRGAWLHGIGRLRVGGHPPYPNFAGNHPATLYPVATMCCVYMSRSSWLSSTRRTTGVVGSGVVRDILRV